MSFCFILVVCVCVVGLDYPLCCVVFVCWVGLGLLFLSIVWGGLFTRTLMAWGLGFRTLGLPVLDACWDGRFKRVAGWFLFPLFLCRDDFVFFRVLAFSFRCLLFHLSCQPLLLCSPFTVCTLTLPHDVVECCFVLPLLLSWTDGRMDGRSDDTNNSRES